MIGSVRNQHPLSAINNENCQPRQERGWQRILKAISALLIAELFVALTLVALIVPGYFSKTQEFTITFHAISAPVELAFPIVSNPSDATEVASLRCEKQPRQREGTEFSLACSYIAENVYSGQAYLEEKGLKLANFYSDASSSPASGTAFQLAWQVALGILGWYFWLRFTKTSLRSDIRNGLSFARKRPFSVLLPYLLSTLVLTVCAHLFSVPNNQSYAPLEFDHLASAVVTAVLVAPMFEEVIFRGVMYDLLAKNIHWAISALVTTASFVVVHLLPSELGWIAYIGIFIMGVGLFWLRRASSSLSLCVVAHAIYNALALASMGFQIN